MNSDKVDLKHVLDAVEQLREEVGRLNGRVTQLETAGLLAPAAQSQVSQSQVSQSQVSQSSPASERLNEDLVLTISAAVAAYLGVQPRIRQIRVLGSASWAQSGRATIQASHAARPHHG